MRTIGLLLMIVLWGGLSGVVGTLTVLKFKPHLFDVPSVSVPIPVAPDGDLTTPQMRVDATVFVVRVKAGIEGNETTVNMGHGFASDDRRIVTNAHVVNETPNTQSVAVFIGGTWRTASRVVWSTKHDVAIIEFASPHGLRTAGMRGIPAVGTPVFYYNTSENRLLTGRTLSEETVTVSGEKFLETTLPSRKGDSGGPVFDDVGNIVGMITRAAVTTNGAEPKSYMLSAQLIRQVVLTLVNHREPEPEPDSGG